ncbi:hypothetical protein QBC35DRAFT_510361 [Podospora australis]|uniref:Uncharacterized protein n=1 Tax=Podospora australis TaxID=1536484 RepID=A0AAN7AB79_9PEZI|nr:hypothetical protein QBC35DRAFT_510361 [Podospora australis]
MEAIAGAASVVGLIGGAITVIQQVRNARNKVKGAPITLDNLSKHLDSLDQSLSLVREEQALQTASVGLQVRGITDVAKELQSFLDALASEQQKRSIQQLMHTMKSGDLEDKQLVNILDRLDRARDLLVLQISVAQVGLMGNLKDGFRVAFAVLMDTNKKVNEVLGIKLVLAERLKNRELQQMDGTVSLDTSDLVSLGLIDKSRATPPDSAVPDTDETLIYDNTQSVRHES